MTSQELLAEFLKLPPKERFAFAGTVFSSMNEGDALDIDITPEFAAELERRYLEAIAHPEILVSLDDAEREILAEWNR
ncbi:MAG TPA: addiction module protein [Planctomycetota bacterium]|nr:addiction module protein [Planctomycetota bacterium]